MVRNSLVLGSLSFVIALAVMVVIALVVLGLIFGSFVNALVWRLRQQELAREKIKVRKGKKRRFLASFSLRLSPGQNRYSILTGRSMCPNCHHELAARDLVPVVSWLLLNGKCRYCHKPISWQYPLVEIITAALFALSYIWWPLVLQGVGIYHLVFWLIFLVGFMALAVYDLRWFLLPNRLIFPLIGLAVVQLIGSIIFYGAGWQTIITAFWGVVVASGIFYAIFMVSKGEWIGGGDVKLGVVIGILLGGPLMSLLMLFVASCLGTIVGLPFLLAGKRQMRIPFGPFLLAATIFVTLFGASILHWYKSQFLL